MISIHKMEYESIINENKSLKLIITRALGYEFKEELPTIMTIEELTLENKLLHSRIQQLEIKLDIELEQNKQHDQRIQSLESDNQILKAEHVQLKEEIKELKAENVILKEEIKELKAENVILKKEIKELKAENVILKKEIKELKAENVILKKDNQSLHDKVNKLELKDEYNKFMVAIQDINSMYSLERVNSSFKDLREDRVNTCHYIKENDPQDLKDAKIKILYDKLQIMNNSIREDFDDLYPNVIDEVIKHLTIKSVSDKLMKRVNKWWD